MADRLRTERTTAVIGCRPRSACIKAAANEKTSVACPATRRDGRRRLRLRKRKEPKITLEVRNLKVELSYSKIETSNCESEKSES